MLATQQDRARGTMPDKNAQVADKRLPARKPVARPEVSLWDRATAFGCIGIATAILWVIAGVGGKISSTNNQIYQLQMTMQSVSATNATLTAQVDNLTRPTRILNVALNQLHMHYANPIVIPAGNP